MHNSSPSKSSLAAVYIIVSSARQIIYVTLKRDAILTEITQKELFELVGAWEGSNAGEGGIRESNRSSIKAEGEV